MTEPGIYWPRPGGGGTSEPGEPGSDAVVTVGTVTTVPPVDATTLGTATVTDANPDPSIAELVFGIPAGLPGGKGDKGDTGLVWRGAWAAGTAYVPNDVVYYFASAFVALVPNTGQAPTSPGGTWSLVVLGVRWRGAWSSAATYSMNNAVSLNGSAYISIKDSNANHDPASQPTWWELLASKGDPGANGLPVNLIAGAGLTGGGSLATDQTVNVGAGTGITVAADSVAVDTATIQARSERGSVNGYADLDAGGKVPIARVPTGTSSSTVAAGDHTHTGFVPTTRKVSTGTGLTGGGDLTADRTIAANIGTAAGTVAAGDHVHTTSPELPAGGIAGSVLAKDNTNALAWQPTGSPSSGGYAVLGYSSSIPQRIVWRDIGDVPLTGASGDVLVHGIGLGSGSFRRLGTNDLPITAGTETIDITSGTQVSKAVTFDSGRTLPGTPAVVATGNNADVVVATSAATTTGFTLIAKRVAGATWTGTVTVRYIAVVLG